MGEESLFQASARRLSGTGFASPVVSRADFRFIVTEQLAAVAIKPAAILIEPEGAIPRRPCWPPPSGWRPRDPAR
jgi:mannose-1-phosphate guanylyltransferase / mannose-6-phosphate isomerase